MRKQILSFLLAAGMLVSSVGAAAAEEEFRFSDDGSSGTWNWASTYIYKAHDRGIFNGDTDGNFNADKKMTRAEAVTALLALKGLQTDTSVAESGFADADGKWYTPYVAEAKAQGITAGFNEDGQLMFHPGSSITRAEFVTMLLGAMGETVDKEITATRFADADNAWYTPYVARAAELHLTKGVEEDGVFYFNPKNTISRAEAATMVAAADRILNPVSDGKGTCGSNVSWELLSSGTLVISGTGAMEDGDFQSLWADYADDIIAVQIEDGVTSVGDFAFSGCDSILTVSIPESVVSIGNHAFEECTSLKTVELSEGLKSIGDCAFWGCTSLTTLTLPASLTELDSCAFEWCSGLKEMTIPEGITALPDSLFMECGSLTSVTLPATLTYIDTFVFLDCSSLTELVLPEHVTEIGTGAFMHCTAMTSVTIPAGMQSVGMLAFCDCGALAEVNYAGSEKDWNIIDMGDQNECLTNAYAGIAPAEESATDN